METIRRPPATVVSLATVRITCVVTIILLGTTLLLPRFTGFPATPPSIRTADDVVFLLIWFVPYPLNMAAAVVVSDCRISRRILLMLTMLVCILRLQATMSQFSLNTPYFFRPVHPDEGNCAAGLAIVLEFWITLVQAAICVPFLAYGFWKKFNSTTQPNSSVVTTSQRLC